MSGGDSHYRAGIRLDEQVVSWKQVCRNAVTTCAMRDNMIVAPVGRAVTFLARGRWSWLVIASLARGTQHWFGLIASTVLIGDFGISNEWTLGFDHHDFVRADQWQQRR